MKKAKKQTRTKQPKNWVKVGVIACVGLLCSFHIAATAYLWVTVGNIRDTTDPIIIRSMVFNAVDGLRKQAPVDVKTGDHYIPEARMVVPHNQLLKSLVYSYEPASKGDGGEVFDEELTLSSPATISRAKVPGTAAVGVEALFESIPELQACSRAFVIKFVDTKPQFSETTLQAKVSLEDGRTAYIYKDVGCKIDTEEVQNALLKVRSFK